MDGPWQIGHVPADQYTIRAQQTAKIIKEIDPAVELVACGSSSIGLKSYMDWDRQVLEYVGELADEISLHRYVGNYHDDIMDYLAVTSSIDKQIEQMDAVCRFVQAKLRSKKRTYLCFDEWNVWYKNVEKNGHGKIAPHLLEEIYNLEDALVVAGFLHSFIRHADVVKIANLAQIVNVIAPILTQGDDMVLQSIFYPFEMFSKRRNGVALNISLNGPGYESNTNGYVTFIDASSILNKNNLNVFLTNRNTSKEAEVNINIADAVIDSCESAEILTGPDAKAVNLLNSPNIIASKRFNDISVNNGNAQVKLPALSFAAITLKLK
jgi:alpha-L-arabinofuranosidase